MVGVWYNYDGQGFNPTKETKMVAKIQISQEFAYLYGVDNRIIKSEKLPSLSGSSVIAVAKLKTFAKLNGIKVVK
jgi:hypothetical protein